MGFFDRFIKQQPQKLPAEICREHWSKFLENEIEYPEYVRPNSKTTEFINAFTALDPQEICTPFLLLNCMVSELTLVYNHRVPKGYDNSRQATINKYINMEEFITAKGESGYSEEDFTAARRISALHLNHKRDPIANKLSVLFAMDLTDLFPADLLAQVGDQYLSEKKYSDAYALFNELIRFGHTGNGMYHLNAGKALYLSAPRNKNTLPTAVQSLEQAVKAGVSEAEPLLQEVQQRLKEVTDEEAKRIAEINAVMESLAFSSVEDDIKKADKTGNISLYFKHAIKGVPSNASPKEKELICEAARKYNERVDKLVEEKYFTEDNIGTLYSQRRMNIRMAESGIVEFMGRGADAYRDGYDDVRQDLVRAREWYRIAAEHGDQHAQLYYGIFCKEGYGGNVDYPNAVKYLNDAGKGHRNLEGGRAFYNLAQLVYNGQGIAKNEETASLLLEAAEELGWDLQTEIAFRQNCILAEKHQILAKELHKEAYMFSGDNENYGYVLVPLI